MKKTLIAVHVVAAFFGGVRREIQPGQPIPPGLEPGALDDLVRLKAVREEDEDELEEAGLGTQFEAPEAAAQALADAVQALATEQPVQRIEEAPHVGDQSAGDSAGEANNGAAANGAQGAGAEDGQQAGAAGAEGGQAAEGTTQGAAPLDVAQAQDGNAAPPSEAPAPEAPAAAPKKRGSKSAKA